MSAPYFDTDENALRFYNLFARIVIAWSRIERTMDISLAVRARFVPQPGTRGKAIVSWSRKYRAFCKLCRQTDELKEAPKRLTALLRELRVCVEIRHTLVHGYYHGFDDSDPPKVQFRAARFNADTIEQRNLRMSHDDLFGFLQRLHALDYEMFSFNWAIRHARDKAPDVGE